MDTEFCHKGVDGELCREIAVNLVIMRVPTGYVMHLACFQHSGRVERSEPTFQVIELDASIRRKFSELSPLDFQRIKASQENSERLIIDLIAPRVPFFSREPQS